MESIEVKEIIVDARSGAFIGTCQYEAALLALTEKRKVVLMHNDHRYEIDWKDMVDAFKRN